MKRSAFVGSSLCVLAAGGYAAAASRTRLALVLSAEPDVSSYALSELEAKLTGALIKTQKYDVYARSRLDAIIAEQHFSHSALADPATAAKLGKLAGVSQMLIGHLRVAGTQSHGELVDHRTVEADVDFQLVEVNTGRILQADTATGSEDAKAVSGSDDQKNPSGSYDETTPTLLRKAVASAADSLVDSLAGN